MTITLAELARIRSAAIGDMLGDPGALDEMGSAATVFRLCRELELATKRAVAMSEVAAAAWEGEIPSPLPGHTHMTEEGFTSAYSSMHFLILFSTSASTKEAILSYRTSLMVL